MPAKRQPPARSVRTVTLMIGPNDTIEASTRWSHIPPSHETSSDDGRPGTAATPSSTAPPPPSSTDLTKPVRSTIDIGNALMSPRAGNSSSNRPSPSRTEVRENHASTMQWSPGRLQSSLIDTGAKSGLDKAWSMRSNPMPIHSSELGRQVHPGPRPISACASRSPSTSAAKAGSVGATLKSPRIATVSPRAIAASMRSRISLRAASRFAASRAIGSGPSITIRPARGCAVITVTGRPPTSRTASIRAGP